MPRKRRGWEPNASYHITHRCHDQQFLFRFKKYRAFYFRRLAEGVRRYDMDVLNYICTGNHVHILVAARRGPEISAAIRYVHGRIAQWHNKERGQAGAFWNGRFHTTRIQNGRHLSHCLLYIDMNMVRAGAVTHPEQWEYSAWPELTGNRQRYRIINMERLLSCLEMKDEAAFREWHNRSINELLSLKKLPREPFWSSALAVGDRQWLEEWAAARCRKRHRIIEAESVCYLENKGRLLPENE